MDIKAIFKSDLIKSTGIYTFTNLFGAAIPFLLLPFFTRWLTPDDYGKVSMFTLFSAFLVPILGLNINSAIAQKYFDTKQGVYRNARLLWNGFLLVGFTCILGIVIILLFQDYFIKYLSLSLSVLFLSVLLTFFTMVFQSYLTMLQIRKKALKYGLLQMVFVVFSAGLSIILVGYLDFNWLGRVYAIVIASIIVSVISFIFIIRNKLIVFKFSRKDIIHLFKFGLPLIFHSVGGLLIAMVDRLFIANMISLKEAGLYTLAYTVCSVFGMLTNSFNQAFVPWLFGKLNKNDQNENEKIIKFTYLLMIGLIIIALFGTFISPLFLKYFVGKNFIDSQKFFFWLLIGFAFGGMYFLVTNYIFYTAKTRYLAYTTLFSGLLNVGLCYLFIKYNGVMGAAQSFALANIILFFITWIISAKCYPMPWNLIKIMSKI